MPYNVLYTYLLASPAFGYALPPGLSEPLATPEVLEFGAPPVVVVLPAAPAVLLFAVFAELALDLFLDPGPLESDGFRLAKSFFFLSISSRSTAISSCLLLNS